MNGMSPRFQVGDRVKIRRSWSELDGAVGTVDVPPQNTPHHADFGCAHFRQETTLTGGQTFLYWVRLDVHGGTTDVPEGDEFNETELEKL